MRSTFNKLKLSAKKAESEAHELNLRRTNAVNLALAAN